MTVDQKIALSDAANSLNLTVGFQTVILNNENNGGSHILSLPKTEVASTIAETLKEHLVYRSREREFSEIGKMSRKTIGYI
jgi:hypothetical protein